jgi:hypothetical protein
MLILSLTSSQLPGHSIVPATIPTATILYHGRSDNRVPDVPEWFAFDFEHSYLLGIRSYYVISVQTKQALRLLYFDGTSAALKRSEDEGRTHGLSGHRRLGETPARQVHLRAGTYKGFMRLGKAIWPGWVYQNGVRLVRFRHR